MKNLKILVFGLAALSVLSSCSRDQGTPEEPQQADPAVQQKLIFSSQNAVRGSLLVYFSEDAIEQVEHSTLTKSGEVATRSGIDNLDAVLEDIGVTSLRRLFPVDQRSEERTRKAGLHRWYLVEFDESADLDEAALAMASVAEVSNVEFNQKLVRTSDGNAVPLSEKMLVPSASESLPFNDEYLANQWHYINTGNTSIYSGIRAGADVNCADAWKLCTGDPRVVVAVVDDCVQWDHPDLAANMWTNSGEVAGDGIDNDENGYADDVHGFNFVRNSVLAISSVNPEEPGAESHGTHVAGTVAAVNNNGVGVCGIAGGSGDGDGVRIMSCQIFNYPHTGSGSAAVSANAIKYAADNGACILQCSYGYPTGNIPSDQAYSNYYSAEKQAIDYFIGTSNCEALDGGIVIFAAGNDSMNEASYPGAYSDYIAVSAMGCNFQPAWYTNYGAGCNVTAPGGDDRHFSGGQVLSTLINNTYGYMQGTSMACPHVSGVAALGLSYALKIGKKLTNEEYNSILLTSVNDINQYLTSGYRGKMGTGYIDAYQVLMNVRGTTCIPVPVGSQSSINVKEYLGDGNSQISITSASLSADAKSSLGVTSDPVVFGNNILLTCTKTGSGIMTVTMRAGTNSGSGINGMTITKEFALIARGSHSDNDGWL